MDPQLAQLLERYRSGPAAIEAALTECAPDRIDRRPAPEEWSPLEIVHHIADAEIISGGRIRLMLSRDRATLVAYDQEALARAMRAESRPIEGSLALIKALRQSTADLLEALEPEGWSRVGVHEEVGEVTIGAWLKGIAGHCHDHAEQIRRACEEELV
jgi:hypothetical protein